MSWVLLKNGGTMDAISTFYIGGMMILILGNAAQAMNKKGSKALEWTQMIVYAIILVLYFVVYTGFPEMLDFFFFLTFLDLRLFF